MVDASLIKYIQDNHSKGYSLQTLRSFLLKEGYSPLDIEAAIKQAYSPKHGGNHKLLLIVGIVAVLVILVAAIFLAINFLTDDTVITSTVTPQSSSISPTDSGAFTVFFRGADKSTPIVVRYEIYGAGSLIDTVSESADAFSGQKTYRLDPLEEGSYTITVTVTYKETESSNSYTLSVASSCGDGSCDIGEQCVADCAICGDGLCEEGEVCALDCDEIVNAICGDGICELGETCSIDCIEEPVSTCGDNICQETENPASCSEDCSVPICGDNICESLENQASCPDDCKVRQTGIAQMTNYQITQFIKEVVADEGANAASKQCDKISEQSRKDHCFDQVSRESVEGAYCKFIKSSLTRDECYLTYAYNANDFSVCGTIKDAYKLQTCETLAEVFA